MTRAHIQPWRQRILGPMFTRNGKQASAKRRRRVLLEQLETRDLFALEPISLASSSLYGATGLKDSSRPSLSADGQLIAFRSNSDNLVPNDLNGLPDIFAFHRDTNEVSLVSVGSNDFAAGVGVDNAFPVISPDGRYVVFEQAGGGILSPFVNSNIRQLYLRDLASGTAKRQP